MNNPTNETMHRFFILFLTFFLAPIISAQDPFDGTFNPDAFKKETTTKVTPEVTAVEPGDFFRVAFTLDLQPHFHAYFKNAGIVGDGPTVTWELPEGFTAGELLYPQPTALKSASGGVPATIYGYEGRATFVTKIDVSEDLADGKKFTFKGTFNYQECDDSICLPPQVKEFSFDVTVGETTFIPAHEDFFQEAAKKLPQDNSAWGAIATESDNEITLNVLHPPAMEILEPVYFFSTDEQIDSQAPQKVDFKKGKVPKIILTLARNEGNEKLYIAPGKVTESISGLLTFNTEFGPGSIEIKTDLTPDANVASSSGHLSAFVPATDEDREAGLAVYDVDARPAAVSLGGAVEKEVTFFSSLLLVFLGGLILNLMPCVFPVLGLKVMSFVSQAGEDESKIKVHGLVFGLGLLIAMWILAAIIISLKLDWGQQLANRAFLATMIIFFFLMGLNLYGVFEIGTSLTGVGGELQGKKGYSGSFFSGVLTTLVATPCSGPFLGAAMAFALAQPPAKAFVIFTVFGLGIASPYILLSFFPALIKKLPRPGAWMESFKQIMSFFVFATAVFFMKGYMKLVGDKHFNLFLFALLLIGLGAYIYGRWGTPMVAKTKRYVTGYGLAAILTVGGFSWAYSVSKKPDPGLAWHEWYPGIMEVSRPKGRIIWLDYTADW